MSVVFIRDINQNGESEGEWEKKTNIKLKGEIKRI